MGFLDNTKRGFAEEVGLVIIFTALLSIIVFYQDMITKDHPLTQVLLIAIPLFFFITFFSIRVIRLALVYRTPVWLYMFNLLFVAMLLATGMTLANKFNVVNLIIFSATFSLFGIYLYITKNARKFKRFSIIVPPERYAILRSVMTKKQRFTLIFPDRYIKYLETGDKKYLDGDENAGK